MASPFKMKPKTPMMKALVGNQHRLPDHLKKAIEAAPESPAKSYGSKKASPMKSYGTKKKSPVMKDPTGKKIKRDPKTGKAVAIERSDKTAYVPLARKSAKLMAERKGKLFEPGAIGSTPYAGKIRTSKSGTPMGYFTHESGGKKYVKFADKEGYQLSGKRLQAEVDKFNKSKATYQAKRKRILGQSDAYKKYTAEKDARYQEDINTSKNYKGAKGKSPVNMKGVKGMKAAKGKSPVKMKGVKGLKK